MFGPLIDLFTLFEGKKDKPSKKDGGGLPVGSKRKWKSGTHVKTNKGWVPMKKGGGSKTPKQDAPKLKHHSQSQFQYKSAKPGQIITPGSHVPIPTGIQWSAPKHEPMDSDSAHRKGGRYTPERRKLHREILTSFLDKVKPVPKGKQPMAVMMMGGPASGKGRLAQAIKDDEFVKVDADSIKELLPEYQEMVLMGDKNAASYVHKESGYLASKLRDIARAENKNMVLDGTGKYASSYLHRMQQLQDSGYHVQIQMADLDADTAVKRSKARAAETGRHVPESVIRGNYSVIPGNFLQIANAADTAILFDNREDFPRAVWSQSVSTGPVDLDAKFMSGFRSKHGRESRRPREQTATVIRDIRNLIGEADGKKPAVDPEKLWKQAVDYAKENPEKRGEAKFGEGEGIIVPENDDVAMGEA